MPRTVQMVLIGTIFAGLSLLARATPVDVNADGIVGPQEVIDLSKNWKGPAGVQPWQIDGTTIFYNAGAVSIGTALPGARFQVTDGRIRIRESATLERWDLFYDPPSEKFYFQENAGYNHLVFTKGPDSQVGIGTDTPHGGTSLHVMNTTSDGIGVYGETGINPGAIGVWGVSEPPGDENAGGIGVQGAGFTGVAAYSHQSNGTGLYAEAGGYAGYFVGNVAVNGNLDVTGITTKSSSSVRIDHPLDPENKVLSHSSVGSPDMMNIYSGNVTTDAKGYAEVKMPDYFEALNKDFRYQLTVMDDADSAAFVQAKVVKRIEGNQFTIRTSHPNVDVSWLVTGIRQDAYAKANPLEVEKIKKNGEKGKYLTPEVYGQPKEMGIGYRASPKAAFSSARASRIE